MENKKKVIMVVLSVLVCVMAVGYAVLAQRLNINGRASIDSTWKVEITNIQESEVTGSAVSKVTPSYTSTTANFSVGLTQPGDSITYNVEISNLGTLNAKVDSINVVMDENEAIKYTTSGIKNGDKLASGEKATLTVKVEYDSNVTTQPTKTNKDLTVTINYIQDIVGSTEEVSYDYVVGDKIEFAGSNWYVIKDSSSDEDYVTLLKEKILTNAELGSYAANYTCDSWDAQYDTYKCTSEGKIIKYDSMSYYWSDTCHIKNIYGYTDYDSSGCSGHNDYEGSKIKEFLEGTYINTLGSDKLKEIDGYKIRLITLDELNTNLGWVNLNQYATIGEENINVPIWIYQNFGSRTSYWTMTPVSDYSDHTWVINYNGGASLRGSNVNSLSTSYDGVRPVINLLKANI